MALTVVTRQQWGARPPKGAYGSLGSLKGFAIHWSAGKAPTDHAKCDDQMRGFQNYHMDSHGWNDIAYSHVVCPHGIIYEGRGWLRRTAANGSNAGNDGYHAVCVMAAPGDPLPLAVESALKTYYAEHAIRFPLAKAVVPHNFFGTGTQCPGELLERFIDEKRYLPATEPKPKLVVRYEVRAGIEGKRRLIGRYRLAYLLSHPGIYFQAVKALKHGESVLILRKKVAVDA